jgi:hypothetical protein
MPDKRIKIRTCQTPGITVETLAGWSVENDPCKDQMVEIFDDHNRKVTIVTMAADGPVIEIYDYDPESGDFDISTCHATKVYYAAAATPSEVDERFALTFNRILGSN